MTIISIRSPTKQHGFSYIEVLVATVLIIVSLVPALEALQTGIHANQVFSSQSLNHHALVAKIEEVIAKPFDELATQAAAAGGPPPHQRVCPILREPPAAAWSTSPFTMVTMPTPMPTSSPEATAT